METSGREGSNAMIQHFELSVLAKRLGVVMEDAKVKERLKNQMDGCLDNE